MIKYCLQKFLIKINASHIATESQKDAILSQVIKYIRTRWPPEYKIPDYLRQYFNKRLQLNIINQCIFYGHRIVIPSAFENEILNELHNTHQGIVRTKALARSYVWFPNIDAKIESMIAACQSCLLTKPNPPKSAVSWPAATAPFQIVHIDYFTLRDKQFLILIDSYTKWIEVEIMHNIRSEATIEKLREWFGRFGIPGTLISDNGPSLVSSEIEHFFTCNGIKHLTISPYNPQSNGPAENAVRIIKQKLKTELLDSSNKCLSLNSLLHRILFAYRTTPHSVTRVTPAELMFGRKVRTRFDLLTNTPIVPTPKVNLNTKLRQFEVNDMVVIRNYTPRSRWIKACIVKKMGNVTYLCQAADGKIHKRHANQIIGAGEIISTATYSDDTALVSDSRSLVHRPVEHGNAHRYGYIFPQPTVLHETNVNSNASENVNNSASESVENITDNSNTKYPSENVPSCYPNKRLSNRELLDVIGLPNDYFDSTPKHGRPKRVIQKPSRYM